MHELAVTQGILDVVLAAVAREGEGRITTIDLVVGELASIVDDSVQFYWDIIAEDTAAAGAVLRFKRVAMQFECRDCQALFEPRNEDFRCLLCGSGSVRVARGDELRVEAFEFEPDPPPRSPSS